ncbi:hypothetical protein AGLY_004802 [Aphis glycines]|uniref:Uncharacterized protein n=1 Tax=Aphis glycines TaxID=307491 RepID=A0A6G0TVE9_APHGL|nr:hypothetical protein AGLY_004802 [Aphis glycines]
MYNNPEISANFLVMSNDNSTKDLIIFNISNKKEDTVKNTCKINNYFTVLKYLQNVFKKETTRLNVVYHPYVKNPVHRFTIFKTKTTQTYLVSYKIYLVKKLFFDVWLLKDIQVSTYLVIISLVKKIYFTIYLISLRKINNKQNCYKKTSTHTIQTVLVFKYLWNIMLDTLDIINMLTSALSQIKQTWNLCLLLTFPKLTACK